MHGDINGMFHILSILVTITTWHVKYFFMSDRLNNDQQDGDHAHLFINTFKNIDRL